MFQKYIRNSDKCWKSKPLDFKHFMVKRASDIEGYTCNIQHGPEYAQFLLHKVDNNAVIQGSKRDCAVVRILIWCMRS